MSYSFPAAVSWVRYLSLFGCWLFLVHGLCVRRVYEPCQVQVSDVNFGQPLVAQGVQVRFYFGDVYFLLVISSSSSAICTLQAFTVQATGLVFVFNHTSGSVFLWPGLLFTVSHSGLSMLPWLSILDRCNLGFDCKRPFSGVASQQYCEETTCIDTLTLWSHYTALLSHFKVIINCRCAIIL